MGERKAHRAQTDIEQTVLRSRVDALLCDPSDFEHVVPKLILDGDMFADSVSDVLAETVPTCIDKWLDLLNHFRWRVRAGALKVLGRAKALAAVSPIVDLLATTLPAEVRSAADDALALMLHAAAESARESSSTDIDTHFPLASTEERTLGIASPLLTAAANTGGKVVADAVIDCMAELNAVDRWEVAISGLRNRSNEAVVAFASATAPLQIFAAIHTLALLLNRTNAAVVRAVKDALVQLIKASDAQTASAFLQVTLESRDWDVAIASYDRLTELAGNLPLLPACGLAAGDNFDFDITDESGVPVNKRNDAGRCQEILIAGIEAATPNIVRCLSRYFRNWPDKNAIVPFIRRIESLDGSNREHARDTAGHLMSLLRDAPSDVAVCLQIVETGHVSFGRNALTKLQSIASEDDIAAIIISARSSVELVEHAKQTVDAIKSITSSGRPTPSSRQLDGARTRRIRDRMEK